MWRWWMVMVAACGSGGKAAMPDARVVDAAVHVDAARPDGLACLEPSLYVASTGASLTRASYDDALANVSTVVRQDVTFSAVDATYASSLLTRAKQVLDPYATVETTRPAGVVPYNMVLLVSAAEFDAHWNVPGAYSIARCGLAANEIGFVRISGDANTDGESVAVVAGFMSGLSWSTGSTTDCMSFQHVPGATPCVFTDHIMQAANAGCVTTAAMQDEMTAMKALYTCP